MVESTRGWMSRTAIGAVALGVGLCLGPARAAEPETEPAPETAAESTERSAAGTASAVVVRWNAEAGRMEPALAAEMEELTKRLREVLAARFTGTGPGALPQSTSAASQVTMPDGTVGVKLGLDQLHFSVANVRGGELTDSCEGRVGSAVSPLEGPATTPEEK